MNNLFTVNIDLGILLAGQVTKEEYKKPKITMKLSKRITLRQLIAQLGIPEKYISFITVNGDRCGWDTVLDTHAEVILFPYIAGG